MEFTSSNERRGRSRTHSPRSPLRSVDRCYAIAYRILRDPHRAQDAAQQALLLAWRDLPTLREPERFEAWLHRLVVNACYAEARTDRRWTARVRPSTRDLDRSRRGELRRRAG